MSKPVPFSQRFGTGFPTRPLDKEVPGTAHIGLISILFKLAKKDYVSDWSAISDELLHTSRRLRDEFSDIQNIDDQEICKIVIRELQWEKFYIFCERVFKILQAREHWNDENGEMETTKTLEEVQSFFTDEINELLAEENLAYEFANGLFQRRGRPQTQKSLQRISAVLSEPRYNQPRNHYNKAVKFFNERPNPDVENCIKEAVCALEAFTEIIFGKKAAKNFEEAIRAKQGNSEGQIPSTIGESIIKLRAFRGNAKGVAHAALEGGLVSEIEAELVLNLVATYISYLHDKFPSREEEVPF
jgi:hypothetical protein